MNDKLDALKIESGAVTFTRRDVVTTGPVTYTRPHLHASIIINQGIFRKGSEPPKTLEVVADGLRVPVDPRRQLHRRAAVAHTHAHRARLHANHLVQIAQRDAQQ